MRFTELLADLMLYRAILVSGADVIEIMYVFTKEGSTFDDFSSEKSAEISMFSPQQNEEI